MVGILLLTHAPLGSAFMQAAAHVFRGMPEHFEAIDVIADQNIDDVNRLAKEAIKRLDAGTGVLVMTDVLGGTPSNCCRQLGEPDQVATIAGVSLPMLLRAITYRHDTLDVVVEMALAGGQNGALRVDNRVRLSPN
ncbi:PTS fructose transporter subunit IIA [Undibacterium sp. RTI2.1]|uniref:PTS sugar transporter subunit IIA n=1 Tax=unclassified Undibacterium TaxID=2630295 RepID=UPI002AB4E9E9|nr:MULTISPECIES: PTS fructose transporter subunit IIA [unclassified Undibacterium]MDY7539925.1 PTS fructose transporter subunit IIA [Undibacterium sp. 5I1]MEB0031164.1 PTS fructose transporter subunit IIA [Undibacterium sp. RTI2.1]MEB0116436.1 PTS fructose transporter subunit IIA [Undibacterium sp. RTI2.2]MEB0230532.1 PTS fructose transporter subunit IIA [Undibacterium sp. 10I3]MEB0257230.1 PTS fructose transporter subunit IIA [Undibacterium sp. 5I1]